MSISSFHMRAGNITLVMVGLAIIAFGIFLSRRVSTLANEIVYQNTMNQAALTGQAISTAK